jgi:Cu+-exporting ATPase
MNLRGAEELVKDPVCGMVKPKGEMKAELVFMGKAYYFCTEGDKKMFEAHPEHWLPRKEYLEKAGK